MEGFLGSTMVRVVIEASSSSGVVGDGIADGARLASLRRQLCDV